MPDLTTRGRVPGPLPGDLLDRLAEELAEHDMAPEPLGDGLRIRGGAAEVQMTPDGLAVAVSAGTEDALTYARAELMHVLGHADRSVADRLCWDGIEEGGLPPNLRFATVQEVRPLHGSYLRIRLACDRLETFSSAAMHFRLILPPPGRTPVWPSLDRSGQVLWPKGEDTPHRPPYTFVEIDLDQGWFTFDLFQHDGGRATEWARAARPGDAVTLLGPGGGDFPPGDWILLAGDETALPAIRRILAQSAPDRRGQVLIETGDPADRCDLAAPPGIRIDWMTRGEGTLLERMQAVALPDAGQSRYVWMGAEKRQVRAARKHFRGELGMERSETYLTAYWTAP